MRRNFMAFKKPEISTPSVDIEQARIYLRGVKKFGKTTLFNDIVLEKYKDASCGVLLGIGTEMGYKQLPNINATQIGTWQEMLEFKDWVLSDDEDAKKIKIIGIDTIDELIPIVEKEVCDMSERKYKKVCHSINDAYKGWM